ncbi:MAG: spore coat protein [Clostridia bacterium]
MNDQAIMENLLQTTKGVCDLYMHGTIESATPNVHTAFDDALEQSLCMQDNIYKRMSQQGWYPTEQAPQPQVDKVKNKFASVQ